MSEIEIIKDKVCFDELVKMIEKVDHNIYLAGDNTLLSDYYKKECYDNITNMLKDRGYIWTEKH